MANLWTLFLCIGLTQMLMSDRAGRWVIAQVGRCCLAGLAGLADAGYRARKGGRPSVMIQLVGQDGP